MSKKQLNVRVPNITRRQLDQIGEWENMTAGEIVTLGVDRLYAQLEQERNRTMDIYKYDHVLIDGKRPGSVVQDGVSKSLISTKRSDGEPGWQQDWYDNSRLTVTKRRRERAIGNEAELGIELY